MKITIRLYRQHDLDLIALFKNDTFSLPKAMKKALIAYVRSEPLEIKPPAAETLIGQRYKQGQMRIYLNEESDSDVIEWLDKISKGYRNSLIKNITRAYFSTPCIYPYYTAEHAEKEKLANKVKKPSQPDETPAESPVKNAGKHKVEPLSGDQIADKILRTPLKKIDRKTIAPDSAKKPNLPEQISIPHAHEPHTPTFTQERNDNSTPITYPQVNPTEQTASTTAHQYECEDLEQSPKETHKQLDQGLQSNPSEQEESYDDGEALDLFDKMMEGFD